MLRHLLRIARDEWQIARDPVGYARRIGVTLADDCWMPGLSRNTFASEPYLITMGRHVAIANGARFVTHDGGGYVFREEFPDIDVVGRITIGDNVMVGMNAILLGPLEIGSNSVIGAGAVVSGVVPPGSVYAGVPARQVSTFEEYRKKILDKAIYSGLLSRDEKREFVLKYLNGEIDARGNPITKTERDGS
jgi:hypothetical protein